MLLSAFDPATGFTRLIAFGDRFENRRLPAVQSVPHEQREDSWGYDGQFYAQLAVQPDIRDPDLQRALDNPPYRARRILLSWTAHLLGLGRPAWVLQAYALQNALCWLAIAWLLLRWFPPGSTRSFALWFACLFNEGLIISSGRALLAGPSMLLILLAMLALERNRGWIVTALLGIAGLARETNALGASIIGWPPRWTAAEIARRVGAVIFVALPLLTWLAYVDSVLGDAVSVDSRSFALPFTSYFWKWSWSIGEVIEHRGNTNAVFSLLALVSLTLQWAYIALRFDPSNPWWRLGASYGLLMAVLGLAVWGGNPGAATRVVLPMSFAYNVLIRGSRRFWLLLALGNLGVIRGLELIF